MKKQLETTNELPETVEEKPETISLTLGEANDVSDTPKPSKLKDSIKSLFITQEEEESKPKRKRKSTFFQKHLYIGVGICIFLANLVWPEEWKQSFEIEEKQYTLAPNQEHFTAILEPLARIADRHTNISDVNPDVTDSIACITAICAYGLELRSLIVLKNYYEQEKRKQEKIRSIF